MSDYNNNQTEYLIEVVKIINAEDPEILQFEDSGKCLDYINKEYGSEENLASLLTITTNMKKNISQIRDMNFLVLL